MGRGGGRALDRHGRRDLGRRSRERRPRGLLRRHVPLPQSASRSGRRAQARGDHQRHRRRDPGSSGRAREAVPLRSGPERNLGSATAQRLARRAGRLPCRAQGSRIVARAARRGAPMRLEAPLAIRRPPDRAAWDQLLSAAPGATIFHTAAWGELWAAEWGDARWEAIVLEDGGRYAGAIPMIVRRRGPVRTVYSMPFGTYGGPLVRGD